MNHIRFVAIAIVGSALLAPGAAFAQPAATTYYSAIPATAPTVTSFIERSTVWQWHGDAFTAGKSPDREKIVCESIAQRVGKLTAFSAAGQPFDAAALAKCNTHSK